MVAALPFVLLVVTLASVGAQLRTVRTVGTAGLSASTWFGLVTSTMFWFGYGVATRQVPLVVINVPVLLIGLALAVAIVRAEVATVRQFAPYLAVPVVAWVATWVTGQTWLLGVGGTVLVVGRLLPQLVEAARAEDRSGISLGAWVGNASNKVAWSGYGFVVGDGFVAYPSAAAALVSFVVVALVLSSRPRGPRRRRGHSSTSAARSQPSWAR